jgi:hypothetical protein
MSKNNYFIIFIYFFSFFNFVYSKESLKNNDKNSTLKNKDMYLLGGLALLSVAAIKSMKRFGIKIPKNNIALLVAPIVSALGLFALLNKNQELSIYKYLFPSLLAATSLGFGIIARNNSDGLVAEHYYELVFAQLSLYSFLTPLLFSQAQIKKNEVKKEKEIRNNNKQEPAVRKKDADEFNSDLLGLLESTITNKKGIKDTDTDRLFCSDYEKQLTKNTVIDVSAFEGDSSDKGEGGTVDNEQKIINTEEETEYNALENVFNCIFNKLKICKVSEKNNLYVVFNNFKKDVLNNENKMIQNDFEKKIKQFIISFQSECKCANSILKSNEALREQLNNIFSNANSLWCKKASFTLEFRKLWNQCVFQTTNIILCNANFDTHPVEQYEQTEDEGNTNPFNSVFLKPEVNKEIEKVPSSLNEEKFQDSEFLSNEEEAIVIRILQDNQAMDENYNLYQNMFLLYNTFILSKNQSVILQEDYTAELLNQIWSYNDLLNAFQQIQIDKNHFLEFFHISNSQVFEG